MNSYTKTALLVVRLVAFALALYSILHLLQFLFVFVLAGGGRSATSFLLGSLQQLIPLAVALVIDGQSEAIARRVTRGFGE